MYTLYADVPTTRRLTLTHVLAEDDALMYSASTMRAAIDWCADHGETEVEIRTDLRCYILPLAYRWANTSKPGDRLSLTA